MTNFRNKNLLLETISNWSFDFLKRESCRAIRVFEQDTAVQFASLFVMAYGMASDVSGTLEFSLYNLLMVTL